MRSPDERWGLHQKESERGGEQSGAEREDGRETERKGETEAERKERVRNRGRGERQADRDRERRRDVETQMGQRGKTCGQPLPLGFLFSPDCLLFSIGPLPSFFHCPQEKTKQAFFYPALPCLPSAPSQCQAHLLAAISAELLWPLGSVLQPSSTWASC